MRDSTNLKDLNDRVVLRVQEEPLPESSIPSLVAYQVDQNLIGNMLVNDPGVLLYAITCMMDPMYCPLCLQRICTAPW